MSDKKKYYKIVINNITLRKPAAYSKASYGNTYNVIKLFDLTEVTSEDILNSSEEDKKKYHILEIDQFINDLNNCKKKKGKNAQEKGCNNNDNMTYPKFIKIFHLMSIPEYTEYIEEQEKSNILLNDILPNEEKINESDDSHNNDTHNYKVLKELTEKRKSNILLSDILPYEEKINDSEDPSNYKVYGNIYKNISLFIDDLNKTLNTNNEYKFDNFLTDIDELSNITILELIDNYLKYKIMVNINKIIYEKMNFICNDLLENLYRIHNDIGINNFDEDEFNEDEFNKVRIDNGIGMNKFDEDEDEFNEDEFNKVRIDNVINLLNKSNEMISFIYNKLIISINEKTQKNIIFNEKNKKLKKSITDSTKLAKEILKNLEKNEKQKQDGGMNPHLTDFLKHFLK
jgi:hypothetical protein